MSLSKRLHTTRTSTNTKMDVTEAEAPSNEGGAYFYCSLLRPSFLFYFSYIDRGIKHSRITAYTPKDRRTDQCIPIRVYPI